MLRFRAVAERNQIKICYDWAFDLNPKTRGKSRVSLFGRGTEEVTAVNCRANMLSTNWFARSETFHPRMRKVGGDEPVPTAEDGIPAAAGSEEKAEDNDGDEMEASIFVFALNAKEHNGWQTSYRLNYPELQGAGKLRRRLRCKANAMDIKWQVHGCFSPPISR